MRLILLSLLLICSEIAAQPRPLRFSITESWAMPLIRLEHGRPTGGILYDLQTRLAQKLGRKAEMLVLPRLRVQQMLERGELDVRCYVNPSWLSESHHQYIWSLPFLVHNDLLISRHGENDLPGARRNEALGTVLGFAYPTLEAQFTSGLLHREDARTQEQVLEKLSAGRYRFAVSNQLSLAWYNKKHAAPHRLQAVGEVTRDLVSCLVRDEPDVPTMALLRAMVQMKQDGEFEQILARYR